jgi:PAS domain S-box-containing protein
MRNRFSDPQARLRLAMAAARLGEWWTHGGEVIHFSRRAGDIYGLGARLAMQRAEIDVMIDPEDRERTLAAVTEAEHAHADFDVEYRVRRANDGSVVWVHGRGQAVYGQTGEPLGLIGIIEDVTSRRAHEEAERLRLHETEHRARNVFTLVQALVHMTPFPSREAFLEAIDERIEALARAHTVVMRADMGGVSIEELVRQELAAYCGPGRCVLAGPRVRLTGEAAQSLAMLLHELVTNAVKHGAMKDAQGRLDVSWRLVHDGGLEFHWREATAGRIGPADAPGTGFGSKLLERLAGQLGGSFRRELGTQGLGAVLAIPAVHIVPPPAPGYLAPADLGEVPAERGRRPLKASAGELQPVISKEFIIRPAKGRTRRRELPPERH